MKRILLIFIAILTFSLYVKAEDFKLSTGIAINAVPKAFFGSWQVSAKIEDSNSYGTFKPIATDVWNLSRVGDRISLDNPFSGANAEISVRTVEGNLIVFAKKTPYENKMLTDVIAIRINGEKFTGYNDVVLESFSRLDGHLLKTEKAKYQLKGERIAGENIIGDK